MKAFIQRVNRRSIVIFFGTLYAIALLFALFPPLYLWGSGIRFFVAIGGTEARSAYAPGNGS